MQNDNNNNNESISLIEDTPIYLDSLLLKVVLFLGTARMVEALFS